MNYGSEPADQVVRYSLEGAEFALRISGTAAKNFFIFAQAVLHDSKKTHGKTHLIRLLKEQKPLKFFTVDKDRILFIRGERPVVDLKYNLLKHPNIRYTEDGGAAPYDYTAADNALDDLPGAPENYELLDMDDFLPTEAAEMKPTIQRIRRPK